jgi:hypothetical protein
VIDVASDNVLGRDDRPRFFTFDDPGALGLQAPEPRRGVAIRTYVRSLAGMQKEALGVSSAGGPGWRLVSDEGPYLAGHDEAPFPLAFFNAGMVASYLNEVVALATQRSITYDDLRLVLDNHYTMEGSALEGTMRGGALAPEVRVQVATAADGADVRNLAVDAVDASPLNGLLRGEHTSLFTLTHNGAPLDPERAAALDRSPLPDLEDRYDEVGVDGPDDAHALMRILRPADATEGEGGKGSSLQAEQKRTLHVRGIGTIGADGVKDIDVQLFKPIGSNFRFRSAEPGAVVSSTATPRNRSHAGQRGRCGPCPRRGDADLSRGRLLLHDPVRPLRRDHEEAAQSLPDDPGHPRLGRRRVGRHRASR